MDMLLSNQGLGLIQKQAKKASLQNYIQVNGGIDLYTNAISDIYQDVFDEGIFTGKGIYDVEIFHKILSNEIPENKVLSHDLLEGCYLRCRVSNRYISFR